MKKLFLLLCMLSLSLYINAVEVEKDGIYYNLIAKAKVAEVIAGTNLYKGTVIIPETFEYEGVHYNVTTIQEGAFASCKELTSVTIANSITSIGEYAFKWCDGLTSVTIGSGVTEIGEGAFWECIGLTNIVIPDNVTSIAVKAFTGCTKLASVTLPKDLQVIGNNFFYNCTSLSTITIPTGVTMIGDYAFSNCKSLTTLTIPESVTSIGNSAFAESGLTSMTIPANAQTVGNGLFHNCSSLISAMIPNTWTEIPASTFAGCSSLESFTIPSSVTYIDGSAFDGCTSLTSMTIPGTVTTIASAAFNACTGLTSVTFENGVETIGGMVFRDCSKLETVTFPESVTKIDNEAFLRCTSLKSIALPNSLTWLGANTFKDCSGMTSLTIGTGLTYIDNMVFEGCSSLTSVVIPGNVSEIGKFTFRGCTALASITFSEGLVDIGNEAFKNCTSLTTVTIPNSVDGIGSSTFAKCENLKTVKLGIGTRVIGYLAFSSCENLEDVYVYAEAVEVAYDNVFEGSYPKYITLHVPNGCVDAYKAKSPWSQFGTIIELGESITITAAKQSTYCSDKNLDFSSWPDLKAYVATGYDKTTGTIWLTRVKDVPANTGFLLMGEPNTYDIPVKEGVSDSYYVNLFKGTLTSMKLQATEGANTNYYLSDGSYGVGFYKPSSDGVDLGANRAYLSVPTDIQPVGTAGGTETINVSSALQMTYCSNNSLDFTEWDQVKAYTATGYNYNSGTIWLTRVKKVPAGTGILIIAPEGSYPITKASVASVYANMFVGTLEGKTIQTEETIGDVDYINYYLSAGKYGVGFYKVGSEGIALSANRSYLPIKKRAAVAGTRGISSDTERYGIRESDDVIAIHLFQGDDATRGIDSFEKMKVADDAYYNLQGQRVNNPGKGLYIKNGKKVVIK